jgi:hypothetical protein
MNLWRAFICCLQKIINRMNSLTIEHLNHIFVDLWGMTSP